MLRCNPQGKIGPTTLGQTHNKQSHYNNYVILCIISSKTTVAHNFCLLVTDVLSQSDKFPYSFTGPGPASPNLVAWQLHVVWVSERDRGDRETGVRDQAKIVLTSEGGSGRAASSLCNAG